MSESNGFAVKGTLDMVANGKMDIDQAVEIVNMWIELTARKFYAEGVVDGLRRNTKLSSQRSGKVYTSHLNDLGIDSF